MDSPPTNLRELFPPVTMPSCGTGWEGEFIPRVETTRWQRPADDLGGGGTHPFLCPATTDGSTASTVEGGTVNGITATGLTPTISNSGTKYVYLDVTYTQSVSSNGYVMGFTGAITCAVATDSSVPSDTSTHLYRQIATYVSGVKTVQAITTSMEVVVRDDGSGTSVSTAIWGTS